MRSSTVEAIGATLKAQRGTPMVVSILMRKTRIAERSRRESALRSALPKIRNIVQTQPGFASLQYLWDVHEEGALAQITTWNSDEYCRRYVREGAAATVATIEESALPTAPHPEGAWVRRTFETIEP
jgi:heme-degrading monooxygenase HmoA